MPRSRKQIASSKKLISSKTKLHSGHPRDNGWRKKSPKRPFLVIPSAVLKLRSVGRQFRVLRTKSRATVARKYIGMSIIIIGIILLFFPTAFKTLSRLKFPKVNSSRVVASATKKTFKQELGPIKIDTKLLSDHELSEPPSQIIVPEFKINLPIVEAKVVDGYWELSETSASHGIGSANPGEFGNTVIFAHARDELFGPLRGAKEGTKIFVLTKDHWFEYRVSDVKLVEPNDVTVIAPTADQTLTLYTCDGFFDSKRLILTAKPIH